MPLALGFDGAPKDDAKPGPRYAEGAPLKVDDGRTGAIPPAWPAVSDVGLIEAPGHTSQGITMLVHTVAGVDAFTPLWRSGAIPDDLRATEPEPVQPNRDRVLDVAAVIVPGHGAPFAVADAPRVGEQ